MGYCKVGLCSGGKQKLISVHRLVAFAFPEICGEYFEGSEIDHISTIKTDNRPENLRWVSHSDNMNNPITKAKATFEKQLKEYNSGQMHPIIHINTTFERLANSVQDVIDERDDEMQDVLDDLLNYCYNDGLIPVSDSWKY